MTRASFEREPNRLCLIGHAGYHAGNDIVCAAISALVYALVGYLDSSGADYICDIGDGAATVECETHTMAFETVLAGLRMIAAEYPENLQVMDDSSLSL